jgi:hypothetical protein
VAKVADLGGKRLLGLAPDAWARWVTQQDDVTVLEILGSDFQWVSRENDVLMKVYSPIHDDFLILTELQLRTHRRLIPSHRAVPCPDAAPSKRSHQQTIPAIQKGNERLY